jgi:hypothetical protein
MGYEIVELVAREGAIIYAGDIIPHGCRLGQRSGYPVVLIEADLFFVAGFGTFRSPRYTKPVV